MKKIITIVVISLFAATGAFAENFISGEAYGNFGVPGYALDMNVISLQELVGLGMDMPADSDNLDSDLDLLVGARIIKGLLEGDNSSLNGFAGVIFTTDGTTTKDGDANTEIEIQAGLQPEYFITDNVSISVMMGIHINLADDRRGVEDTGSTCLGTFADPMANAVVSWYLK